MMTNNLWMIVNTTNKDYFWSNNFGWTDDWEADTFNTMEKENLNLPIDGEWVPVA